MSNQLPVFYHLFNASPIASTTISVEQELNYDYNWSIQIKKTGADGNPKLTLQCKTDGSDIAWDDFDPRFTDFILTEDSHSFYKRSYPFKFMRIKMDANGTTTGTITAVLTVKSI